MAVAPTKIKDIRFVGQPIFKQISNLVDADGEQTLINKQHIDLLLTEF